MQASLKKDTLSYQLGVRPLVKTHKKGDAHLPNVITNLRLFISKPNMTFGDWGFEGNTNKFEEPEADALSFYMLNHAVSLVRRVKAEYAPLEEYLPIVTQYHTMLAMTSTRMFFYLLMICTRETRHEKSEMSSTFWKKLKELHGAEVCSFHNMIKNTTSSKAVATLQENPPNVSLAKYTEFMVTVFNTGKFNSSYGGTAWGAIAQCLHSFAQGETSAEVMVDTAFTLCHNNGPIFNKGMLYETYTNDLYKILDVQRSGQIPQLIAEGKVTGAKGVYVLKTYKMCKSILGEEFGGYVDWFKVETLGALKSYTLEQNTQVTQHGYPADHKALLEMEAAKKQYQLDKEKTKEMKLQTTKNSEYFQVMPNLYVKKEVRLNDD